MNLSYREEFINVTYEKRLVLKQLEKEQKKLDKIRCLVHNQDMTKRQLIKNINVILLKG